MELFIYSANFVIYVAIMKILFIDSFDVTIEVSRIHVMFSFG